MWHWIIIEYEKRSSNLTLPGYLTSSAVSPCHNVVHKESFDPLDNTSQFDAFVRCEDWLEKNRSQGSKYFITEGYDYESK
jgi:hypothetical protein